MGMTPDSAKLLEDALNLLAEVWDRQLETDAKAGKLDKLAERAVLAHAAGQSTEL